MLYPPNLTHAQLEQPGRFDLRPLTFEHQRHHLQHVPITLTHQNPVFLHPSLTNRTFLPAEERTLLPADDRSQPPQPLRRSAFDVERSTFKPFLISSLRTAIEGRGISKC